ncbi:MAG: response regulator transcription factor [Clostridiaceae bacterium]|nr:response regulator transcription factor [Clostridiaceae bacterium]
MEEIKKRRKIIIIEDEVPIAELLAYSLKKEGFLAKFALDGNTGMEILREFKPDLIILDLMLPDISGFDICRQVTRDYNIPIIMLTAKSDITDKILGLELGADDYITKPFDIREAIVRIKTIFRRIERISESLENKASESIIITNDIKIFNEEHKVAKNNEFIELTPKEYALLFILAQNKGRVFSRSELLDKVWGFDYFGDSRTVDIHIQRIRKKLDTNKNISIIETVFGTGYKLVK